MATRPANFERYCNFSNQSTQILDDDNTLIKQFEFFEFKLDFSLNTTHNIEWLTRNKNEYQFENNDNNDKRKEKTDLMDNNNNCNMDKYELLLNVFMKRFEIFLLIPPEIENLILLYFRDYTFIYMLYGGKNCGISCISTNKFSNNIDLKIYDISTYNKYGNEAILTSTFMNEWDLNTMKLCVGKDINISKLIINGIGNRSEYDILFKAQKLNNNNNDNSFYYYHNYGICGILINPLNILYHDIDRKIRKNKYIRTSNNNSYHNSIKTFEFKLPSIHNVAGFDMIYTQNNGLLIVGDSSDIQSLQINDNNNNKNILQWQYLCELPSFLKWKTKRTLQIIDNYDYYDNNQQLFICGGLNIAISTNYWLLNNNNNNNNNIFNNISKKASIYNFKNKQWITNIPDLQFGRKNGKSYFSKNNKKIFVGAGTQYDKCDIVEMFDIKKYNKKWNILPKSINKHYEKVSIWMNEIISPSLLYIASKSGAECLDLRNNEWINLLNNNCINSFVQCLNIKTNIGLTL